MYVPKHYAVTDRSKMLDFIHKNGFGILFSHTGAEPMASHMPFILDEQGGQDGLILWHMARANPQSLLADGQHVGAGLHGPPPPVHPGQFRPAESML